MARRTRRHHTPAFKEKAALAATKSEKTLPAKIGKLTLVNCFLEGAVGKAGLLSARR